MQIIVSIRDVWERYGDQRSRFLANLGLQVEDLVHFAFGFMVMSQQPPPSRVDGVGMDSVFRQVARLLNDRLPAGQSVVYGPSDPTVHRVVDAIGEISHLMADSVTRQIGSFPTDLRLLTFTGPDIILTTNENSREPQVRHHLTSGRP